MFKEKVFNVVNLLYFFVSFLILIVVGLFLLMWDFVICVGLVVIVVVGLVLFFLGLFDMFVIE